MTQKTVQFDRPKRDRLRVAYEKARDAGQETFTFEGNEYVVGYAKYLLEYLDGRLGAEHGWVFSPTRNQRPI